MRVDGNLTFYSIYERREENIFFKELVSNVTNNCKYFVRNINKSKLIECFKNEYKKLVEKNILYKYLQDKFDTLINYLTVTLSVNPGTEKLKEKLGNITNKNINNSKLNRYDYILNILNDFMVQNLIKAKDFSEINKFLKNIEELTNQVHVNSVYNLYTEALKKNYVTINRIKNEKFNIPNGVVYENISKYLTYLKDEQGKQQVNVQKI